MAIWSYMRGAETLDIKVGYACNDKCIHCVVDPVRKKLEKSDDEKKLSTSQVFELIDEGKKNGIKNIVLTGGEVTIRKDFEKLVTYAVQKDMGVTIQTNGRRFHKWEFVEFMQDFPNLLFIVALHSSKATIHEAITQTEGSFTETVEGICNLKKIGKEVSSKVVISKLNVADLYETTVFAKGLGVDEFCVVFPHALDFELERFKKVVPSYSSIKYQIYKIAEFSDRENFFVSFETIPYCICPDSSSFWRRNCDLHSVASEDKKVGMERLSVNPSLFDWDEVRPLMKYKKDTCKVCMLEKICEGPWNEYVDFFGDNEFVPISEEQVKSIVEV